MSILLLVFFLSGASALAYQIVWIRLFGLVFGGTVVSMSVVVAVFMGGLAVGSHVFGQYAMKVANRVRLYGILEMSLGVLALIVFWAISHLSTVIYSMPFEADARTFAGILVRLLLAVIILIPPTMIMGASLPVLISAVTSERKKIISNTSLLYAVNTLGAMFGALMVGIVLIRYIGVTQTNLLAALINLSMGGIAIGISGRFARKPVTAPAASPAASGGAGERGIRYLVALGITGFIGLALEMVWMRLLLLVFNNTIYLYTIVITLYLFGLAAGGLVVRYLLPRRMITERVFGIVLGAAGAAIAAGYVFFPGIISLVNSAGSEFYATFYGISVINAAAFFLLGFVPVFLMGISFPIGLALYANEIRSLSSRLGVIYAVNTAASLVGSLAAIFVLVPNIGIGGTVTLCVLLALAASLYFITREGTVTRRRNLFAAGGIAGVTILVIIVSVDVTQIILEKRIAASQEITYIKEGPASTIWISEPKPRERGARRIWMDNVWISSTSNEGTHALLAHYPMLLANNPETVAGIAFGTGQTFGACLLYPIDKIVCVEIDKEVITAAKDRFDTENYGVLNDPRTEVVIDDGRFFLQGTSDTFDIVTAEPLQPYTRGTVNLYSREFYAACLRVLNPGGVVAQWIPLYNSGYADTWSMIHTFADVFDHVQLFLNGEDGILLGSNAPMRIDPAKTVPPPALADIRRLEHADLYSLLGNYICSRDRLMEVAKYFPVITDDKPVLEYTAPISQWEEEITGPVQMRHNLVQLTAPVTDILAGDYNEALAMRFQESRKLINMGYVQEKTAQDDEAYKLYLQAWRTNPQDIKAIRTLFQFLQVRGRLNELPPEIQQLMSQSQGN